MNNTLSEMWKRYNLLSDFKKGMNTRGYVGRDLFVLDAQISLLKELIDTDSMNVLGEFITKKSYYRLLKSIDKGIELLPDLIENPDRFVLYNIDKYPESWVETNNLIFTCKSGIGVFSKSQKDFASHYVDNKFQ
jgi:hypothetical protein